MNKILILKTGSTIDSLKRTGQDFEDWIIAGCRLEREAFEVVSVFENEVPPPNSEIAGIIVTGSPAYVTDHEPWNELAAEYLRQAVDEGVPTLGICYGHQLLAYAMGGEVDFHPGGREIGTVDIDLTRSAVNDRLFSDLPSSFKVQVSHQQTVICLPPDAELLAEGVFESHHGFRIGETAWGVQFHPEFSPEIVTAYLQERKSAIETEGLDFEQLLTSVAETPESDQLLQRFSNLVYNSQQPTNSFQDPAASS